MTARLRITRAFGALASALLVATVAGCGAYDQARDAPRSTSAQSQGLLGPLVSGPSPSEAAAWSIDELNADNRYRGTIILANAPFAGQDVYLQLFRDNMNPDREPYAIVRAAAVRGLAHHGLPDEDVPRLLDLLDEDTAPAVRVEIVRALQRLHNPLAVGPLIDIAGDLDASPGLRAEAADALAQYAEPRVLDALIELLRDDSLLVNQTAHDSLTILTGEDLPPDVIAWLDYLDDTEDPFANQQRYEYPIFSRTLKYYEYLPLVPEPPNEVPSTPAGYPEPERLIATRQAIEDPA